MNLMVKLQLYSVIFHKLYAHQYYAYVDIIIVPVSAYFVWVVDCHRAPLAALTYLKRLIFSPFVWHMWFTVW